MAARKLSMLEKMALNAGVLFRYHSLHFPRRWNILKQAAVRELAPPTRAEWPLVKADFHRAMDFLKDRGYRQWTLREALIYGAVGFEVVCWFVMGEIIGRRRWQGYVVPGDYVHPDTAKKAKEMKKMGVLE